jgi:hydrogenase maturation protease
VIDVIKIDDRPGSVYRFTREQMETYLPAPTSAHEVEFFDVLCKADMMGACPEVTFLCAVPQQYSEMGMEMTPVMEQRFATVEGLLLERLAELNIYPERQLCA